MWAWHRGGKSDFFVLLLVATGWWVRSLLETQARQTQQVVALSEINGTQLIVVTTRIVDKIYWVLWQMTEDDPKP